MCFAKLVTNLKIAQMRKQNNNKKNSNKDKTRGKPETPTISSVGVYSSMCVWICVCINVSLLIFFLFYCRQTKRRRRWLMRHKLGKKWEASYINNGKGRANIII